MRITYSPADGDVQQWDFTPDEVRQSEAEVVEKRYGRNWDSFVSDVRAGNAKARRVLLWHLIRRDHHTLRYEDTPDFAMGEVKAEHTLEELVTIREKVQKANLPDEDREQILTALDIEITELLSEQAPDQDVADVEALVEGKAPSPSDA